MPVVSRALEAVPGSVGTAAEVWKGTKLSTLFQNLPRRGYRVIGLGRIRSPTV